MLVKNAVSLAIPPVAEKIKGVKELFNLTDISFIRMSLRQFMLSMALVDLLLGAV